ncbi:MULTISPECIES: hypothetical protein [Stieleria]|uniref:DUF5655 domain-containing protein n=1 Tax=Stieleria magnilauensis TaxID=2527963 RepID=A0ABX5XL17_9BACT|nr:hypothetical protein [Stieleria sedimenti]MCS7470196.1 hypothetical protein [Stieleria sedimenti]MDV6031619.1 hypothetical protein [Phycisphaera sp. RhM]QDV82680.1 hypothetical protein TBK1r_16120 [Planctomycetes bacterium TBK1r]
MKDDFQSRLESAIQRGQRRRDHSASEAKRKELTEEELKRLHTSYRLSLSERIEVKMRSIIDAFPGFRQEALFGEVGWGTACYRDDLRIKSGRRSNAYSRFEMVIRPYSDLRVLDLKGKATVENREIFNRSLFRNIEEVDVEEFEDVIDAWTIEYAEQYAARSA